MFRQCNGERAVLAVAIQRGRAGLGGIGDQRIGARRLDLGEAASDRTRGQRSLHGFGERIVAAGVEDDQPQLLGGLDRHQHAIQRKRLVIDVGVALQLRIDRDQIIVAVDLHAVAGVIDHRNIGVAGAVGKVAQRTAHLVRRQIVAGIDDVETGVLQRGRDHRAIIDGIRQQRHVLIGRVADHQRHALGGPGRLTQQQQRGGEKKPVQFWQSRQLHHDAFTRCGRCNRRPSYQKPAPAFVS